MPQGFGFGAARQFTEKELGGPCTEEDQALTVQVAAGILIQGNGDRVGLVVINLGAFDVYMALSPSVSSSYGIRLSPNGGLMTLSIRDDFTLPSRTWYACAPGGASAVYALMVSRVSYSAGS